MTTNWTEQSVNAYYWNSVEAEALELPYCPKCRSSFFYPRPFCPDCWSEDIEFKPASGFGVVWSHCVVHFAHGTAGLKGIKVPYAVVLVTLEEGVRLMGNLVDGSLDEIKIGMPVTLAYQDIDGRRRPVFKPA